MKINEMRAFDHDSGRVYGLKMEGSELYWMNEYEIDEDGNEVLKGEIGLTYKEMMELDGGKAIHDAIRT